MDEWHVGDPADWGDHVGVPDIPYMGYLQDEEGRKSPQTPSKAIRLRKEAWNLRENDRLDEALDTINRALEYSSHWRILNIKAIILEDMDRYDEALRFYDMALRKADIRLVRDNKARLLERIAWQDKYSRNFEEALEHINQALRLTEDEDDRCQFFQTKARILALLGKTYETYVCNQLADRRFGKVDEFERQLKIIKATDAPMVCIAGRQHYGYSALAGEGAVVELIKEPENGHDPDAIRVEYNGKTVGYVANSPYTMIDEASSASDIQGLFESRTRARVMFEFMDRHLVAKLI